jgi:hypothetical protein
MRCTCIRPRQSRDRIAPRRSRGSSAACHQSQSVWRSSAIAAMAPGTARPARRGDSARGMRIWLSMLRSPGAICSSTHWLTPRRRGGASGLTCQVRSSKRIPRVRVGHLSPPVTRGVVAGSGHRRQTRGLATRRFRAAWPRAPDQGSGAPAALPSSQSDYLPWRHGPELCASNQAGDVSEARRHARPMLDGIGISVGSAHHRPP